MQKFHAIVMVCLLGALASCSGLKKRVSTGHERSYDKLESIQNLPITKPSVTKSTVKLNDKAVPQLINLAKIQKTDHHIFLGYSSKRKLKRPVQLLNNYAIVKAVPHSLIGYSIDSLQQSYPDEPKPSDTYSVIAFVSGIGSILCLILSGFILFLSTPLAVLAFILGIAAFVLGIIGLRNIKNSEGELGGRGFGIAGLVIGSIWLAAMVLAILSIAAFSAIFF